MNTAIHRLMGLALRHGLPSPRLDIRGEDNNMKLTLVVKLHDGHHWQS